MTTPEKMITFAIYKMKFEAMKQTSLLHKGGSMPSFEQAQKLLEKMLRGSLPISITRKDGQENLENEIKTKYNDVSLMVLCNTKCHKYKEKLEDRKLEYHPGCWIIFDNRPGVAQVAIERSTSFDSNTDIPRDCIEQTLCSMFEEHGLTVSIDQKWKDGDFWDAIYEQCTMHNDTIRRIKFEFPNTDRVGPIDTTGDMSARLTLLNSLAQSVNAAKGALSLISDKEKVIRLERTQQDIANMVAMCANNAYNISVRFDHYGMYRNGNAFKAFSEMNKCVIDEFQQGQLLVGNEEGGFALVKWLDEVRNITIDYQDEAKTTKKRKRRG